MEGAPWKNAQYWTLLHSLSAVTEADPTTKLGLSCVLHFCEILQTIDNTAILAELAGRAGAALRAGPVTQHPDVVAAGVAASEAAVRKRYWKLEVCSQLMLGKVEALI